MKNRPNLLLLIVFALFAGCTDVDKLAFEPAPEQVDSVGSTPPLSVAKKPALPAVMARPAPSPESRMLISKEENTHWSRYTTVQIGTISLM